MSSVSLVIRKALRFSVFYCRVSTSVGKSGLSMAGLRLDITHLVGKLFEQMGDARSTLVTGTSLDDDGEGGRRSSIVPGGYLDAASMAHIEGEGLGLRGH